MTLHQFPPDAQHVHDGEDAGPPEVVLGRRHGVGKKPAYMGMALIVSRRPRSDDADSPAASIAFKVAPAGAC